MSQFTIFYNKHDRAIAVDKAMKLVEQLFPENWEEFNKKNRARFMRMSGDTIDTTIAIFEKSLAKK